jgi:hypothetical protein
MSDDPITVNLEPDLTKVTDLERHAISLLTELGRTLEALGRTADAGDVFRVGERLISDLAIRLYPATNEG